MHTPTTLPVADAVRARFPHVFASNQRDGHYFNPWEHPPLPGLSGVLRWKLAGQPARPPGYRARPVPCASDPLGGLASLKQHATRLLWIGHASFLVEMDDTRLVLDPIFGPAAVVTSRVTEAATGPAQIGGVSAVLLTHGHHDHLDGASLRALAEESNGQALFIVPSGLAKALPRACRPFVELEWWQGVRVGNVTVWSVPAQHWHQRGPFDRNRSGWCGYVIEGSHRVYHSGDTGYFEGFRAIGAAFDGIDAACLPLGAYEPTWFMSAQHMSPGQSLDAHGDLGARTFVGMHWGAFDLSDEPVEAGPEALRALVEERALDAARFAVLSPGGSVGLSGPRGRAEAEPVYLHRV